MVRRIVISIMLVVVLFGIGAGTVGLLVRLREPPATTTPERIALVVNTIELRPQATVIPLEAYGTAQADRIAIVGCQISGQVIELAERLRPGVAVSAGQMLVHVDPRDYQAQLDRANSQLAAAQAALQQLDVERTNVERLVQTAEAEREVTEREYNRIRDLLETGASTPRELDNARLELRRAERTLQTLTNQLAVLPQRRAQAAATIDLRESELALAQLDLERCTITAPFDGLLDRVDVDLGEQVAPGQQLLTLLDPRLIEIPLELPIAQRDAVERGTAVRLRLESDAAIVWSGQVSRLSPSADQATRTFSLYAEVDNDKQAAPLLPGMFVLASIDGPPLPQALLVPRYAIRREQVFICENSAAFERSVKVLACLESQVAIAGLEPGTIVITSNLDALYDGAPVQPARHTAASQEPSGSAP